MLPPRRKSQLKRILLLIGAAFVVVWSLAPFVWQLTTSFQLDRELVGDPKLIPDPFTLQHYINIFSEKALHRYMFNTAVVAGSTALICVLFGSLAAFSLSRLRIRGRYKILGFVLGVSMFPQIAIVGPLFLIAGQLGSLDTYRVLIVINVALGVPLVTWILYSYFHSIPREIDDAARIDGAGPLVLLFRIILPMSLPGVVTTGLLAFIAAWNEFMFALSFTFDADHQTVPVGIANFTDLYFIPWGDIAAASVIVTLPLVVLVLIFERHIVAGLTHAGVKA